LSSSAWFSAVLTAEKIYLFFACNNQIVPDTPVVSIT